MVFQFYNNTLLITIGFINVVGTFNLLLPNDLFSIIIHSFFIRILLFYIEIFNFLSL